MAVALCLAVLTGCENEPMSPPPPDDIVMPLEIREPMHDYGVVDQGHFASHSFRLTNRGTEPILFRDARTSCTCVGLQDKGALDEPLPPGKSIDVEVGFSATGAGDSETGAVRFTYTTPSEARFYTASVSLRASVRPDYEVSTDTITAQPLNELNPITPWHTITLTDNYPNRTIQVKEVSCSDSKAETEIVDPKTVRIRYTAEAWKSKTHRRVPIVVETNSERKPRTVIAFVIDYEPLIHVTPSMISVSSRIDGPAEQTIEIQTAIGSRLVEVSASDSIAANSLKPLEGASSKTFDRNHSVTAVIEDTNAAISGEIQISLSLENSVSKTISVPVHRFE
ncbi:hypothetical protein RBSWK_05555 [Rhodopirellula baltica SWK14]|uniref:DUF1573 domain-containing protein n=2 Tax=Rhodopirellula baltica TaxID=265606 RepID=L7CA57_RHOBT|nr:hypothetical protein RBSWK_05555 [Rhodopirellula baltica SWK14]